MIATVVIVFNDRSVLLIYPFAQSGRGFLVIFSDFTFTIRLLARMQLSARDLIVEINGCIQLR